MNSLNKLIYPLLLLSFYSYAFDQSHYDAAYKLMQLIQQNGGSLFIDTVIHRITEKEPALKKHKNDIYTLIQTYLNSQEYKETRIKAILYYFTEKEIEGIAKVLRSPSFINHSPGQIALVKKYEKVFAKLEKEFIEYIQRKLKRKFNK